MKDPIKEQRLIEATKKHYMGPDGKIGVIVRNMGSPIRSQSSAFHDVGYLDAVDDFYQEEEFLPEMDEDDRVTTLGLLFDGLSRGMHLEIKFFDHVLTVHWRGYKVFEEEKGDLLCFVPSKDWENAIDRLYLLARKMDKQAKHDKRRDDEQRAEAKKQSWLNEIWTRWGFKLE